MVKERYSVAVIGASGYTGGELIRLLTNHPNIEFAALTAERNAGSTVGSVHPGLRNHPEVGKKKFTPLVELPEVDAAFSCLPTGSLPPLLSLISSRAKRIFNVAGDFRLRDAAELRKHYPDSAAMGDDGIGAGDFAYFIPELTQSVGDARFINLPGCMAVASIYALYPLFADDLVEPHVVVDAKTGSSGSGKGSNEHPAERSGNFRVHKPHGHRHAPEIRQAIADLTGIVPDLQFSTYSLDTPRGILVSTYSRLQEGRQGLDVKRAFARAYVNQPFLRLRAAPKKPQDFPMLKAVNGSNLAEVSVSVSGRDVVTVAALDNLIKGAAGQAVQAFNIVHGLDEVAGLPITAVGP